MKSYLKMSDVFGGCVISNIFREIKCEGDVVVAVAKTGSAAQAIAHAINSHDELVAMNKELIAALKTIGFHTITDEDGDEVEVLFGNMRKIKEAIEKFDGGAA